MYAPARVAPDAPPVVASISGASVRGALALGAAQALRLLLTVGTGIIMARLLSPHEFGLFAMAMFVPALVTEFRVLGLNHVVVQRPQIEDTLLAAMFWTGLAWSGLLAVTCVLVSPLVAAIFGEADAAVVVCVLAVSLPILGSCATHTALLYRDLRFTSAAAIQTSSDVSGRLVGIGAAVLGAGVWSLVLARITGHIVTCVLTWRASGWLPGRPVRTPDLRPAIAFGMSVTGGNAIQYVIRNADNALIGWAWGSVSLGLYTKAYTLALVPGGAIQAPLGPVFVSGLSRLQGDRVAFHDHLIAVSRTVAWVTVPLAAFCILAADDIVTTLLGPAWSGSGPLLRLLAIGAIVQSAVAALRGAMFASGCTAGVMQQHLAAGVVMIASFLCGLPWGPRGVATAWSIGAIIVLGITAAVARRRIGLGFGTAAAILRAPLVGAVAMIAACTVVFQADLLRHAGSSSRLAIACTVFTCGTLLGAWWTGELAALWRLRLHLQPARASFEAR